MVLTAPRDNLDFGAGVKLWRIQHRTDRVLHFQLLAFVMINPEPFFLLVCYYLPFHLLFFFPMKLFSFNIFHSFLLRGYYVYLSSPSVLTPTVSGCLSETGRGLCCSEGDETGLGCGGKGNAQNESSGMQRKQGRQSLLAHPAVPGAVSSRLSACSSGARH